MTTTRGNPSDTDPAGQVPTGPPVDAPDPDGPRRIDRLVAVYVVVATAWIALGSAFSRVLPETMPIGPVGIDLLRGLGFALATGLVLRVLLRRYGRRLAAAADAERRAADRMHEVARIRTTFLRGISHELRTPLTNIIGYGLTLDDHLDRLDVDTAQRITNRLVVNARRLEQLVLDLLDLDRLSRGEESVRPEPVVLDELVDGVLGRVSRDDHVVHVRAEGAVVHVDREKTERILEELIRNAIRHTPERSNVWVFAGVRGRSVRLTVEDDGPGIDATLRDELFEPFTQGEHAAEAPSPGLGIGMALIRRYVVLQGGRVAVGQSVAGGARFDVVLPRRAAVSDRSAEGHESSESA